MRLRITKCKNTDIFYVIKTVYVNGKQKTKTVERIGNTNEVKQKSNGEDPYVWAKKYVDELNKKEQEGTREILIKKPEQNKKISVSYYVRVMPTQCYTPNGVCNSINI